MPRAVGLDVGSHTIKVCEVDGGARKFRVTRYAEADYDSGGSPEERAEAIADALSGLFAKNKLKRDQIVAALSSGDCLVRNISVPFTGDEQVRKVIRFEAESHLHSHELDEVVVDFHKTGEVGNRSDVLIFAGLKERLRQDLEIYEDAGVDPVQVDLESLALYNTVRTAGLLDPDRVHVVLDFGAEKTNLVITDGDELRIVRSIRIHTDSAIEGMPEAAPAPGTETAEPEGAADPGAVSAGPDTEAQGDWVVVEDAEVSSEEESASAASRPEASSPDREEGGAPSLESSPTPLTHQEFPFLHRVLVEVQRSLVRIRSDNPLGKVLITGGGSLIEGLPAALEDGLQAPVEWVDLRDVVSHDLDDEQIDNLSSFGAVALGLALKPVVADPIGVDFRQDDLRYQKAFDQVKVVLSCCVSLVAILLFVILAVFHERRREAERPWQVLVNESRALAETVLDRVGERSFDENAVRNLIGAVQRKNREYARKYGSGGDFPPLRSAFDVMNEVFRAIHRDARSLDGFKLDGVNITQSSVTLKGSVPDPGQVDRLQESLSRSSELFQEIDPGPVRSDEGVYTFNSFKISLPED